MIINNINTMNKYEPELAIAQQVTNNNILHKLYIPCVGNKSTQTVKRNKSIITTTSKLKEVHADLWGLYKFLS